MKKLFFLAFCGCLCAGCASTSPDSRETVRQGVYAAQDAMNAGRFDLADEYINEVSRVVAPPANRIPVTPIYRRK